MATYLAKKRGNTNQFKIEIRCDCEVYNEEWADLLYALNHFLQEYRDGYYDTVHAYLEDIKEV